MESRFLSRLDNEISIAPDRFSRRSLLAERAAYLARLGEIALARKELEELKGENNFEPHVRVSILINIAEGLCHYYEDMSPKANDRYQRARALAIASNQGDLQAKVDSNIALLDYGAHRFEKMFMHLDDAAKRVASDDNQTLSRICMIAGQTLHLANRFDLASKWYQQAKYFANEALDDASMSAILHNMASIWIVNLRNYQLGGIKTLDKSNVASVGADSTWNFDKIIGSSGLSVLTSLMKAQMRSFEYRYEEALLIYESTLSSLSLKSLEGWQAWLAMDMAWCNIQLGNSEEARAGFNRSIQRLSDLHHLDDRAAILTRLSEGMSILGEVSLANSYKKKAAEAWVSFAALQEDMLLQATGFLECRSSLLTTSKA